MFYHLIFHQVIPVNRLLHLILPLMFSAELNVVTMVFPLGLHLPAHHPTPLRLSSGMATSPNEAPPNPGATSLGRQR